MSEPWTLARVVAEVGVSEPTARRWLADGLVDGMIRIRAEHAQLHADCAAHGVPIAVAHKRRSAGWPLELCGTRPVSRARRSRGQNKALLLAWLGEHGECTVGDAERVLGWTHRSAVSTLSRWVTDGTLIRLRLGVYADAKTLTEAAE